MTSWSLASAAEACGGVVLVVPAGLVDGEYPGATSVVAGGAERADSVRAGLAVVPSDVEYVLVHDAARPLATVGLFTRVIEALGDSEYDAVVPVLEVTDTLKQVDGARITGTIDRSRVVATQTPQGFRAAALRAAHASGGDATDDAALVERLGGSVGTVAGESRNLKITRPEDLVVADALWSARGEA